MVTIGFKKKFWEKVYSSKDSPPFNLSLRLQELAFYNTASLYKCSINSFTFLTQCSTAPRNVSLYFVLTFCDIYLPKWGAGDYGGWGWCQNQVEGWQEDLDHGNPLGMGGWVKGWWGCCEVLLLFLVFKQMFFILLPDTCGLEYPPQTLVFRAPNLLRSSFHKWSIILPPFFGRHHSAVAPGRDS